jgi:SdrD B-like domain
MNLFQISITKISLLFCAFLLIALSGATFKTYGCSCPRSAPCEAFGRASAIFIGRAVEGKERKEREGRSGKIATFLVGKVHFVVEEAFIGIDGKEVDIESDANSSCGYWFEQGELYLVYAYGSQEKGLSTSVCTRTSRLAQATEDLAFLQNRPPRGSGGWILGNVSVITTISTEHYKNGVYKKGVAEIKVTAKDSQGRVFNTVTGDNGDYEFKGLKPGAYTVEAKLPDYYSQGAPSDKLTIVDRGCAEQNFVGVIDGRVSGVLVDADGNPVKGTNRDQLPFVELSSIDETGNLRFSIPESVDEQGRFTFSNIQPGRYLLGINIERNPSEHSPYPPTWYPGVADKSQATIIEVGMAEKLTDYTFKLPGKLTLTPRRVQGIIYWPDGRPVPRASVYLETEDHPGHCVNDCRNTDMNGRFELIGYEGTKYRIIASTYINPEAEFNARRSVFAEPVVVELREDIAGIKMVLSVDQKTFEDKHKKRKR